MFLIAFIHWKIMFIHHKQLRCTLFKWNHREVYASTTVAKMIFLNTILESSLVVRSQVYFMGWCKNNEVILNIEPGALFLHKSKQLNCNCIGLSLLVATTQANMSDLMQKSLELPANFKSSICVGIPCCSCTSCSSYLHK